MIDFELYDDVIKDFSTDEAFIKYTTTLNDIGREEQSIEAITIITCFAHPASDAELIAVSREGYHIEAMLKIFAPIDSNIKEDDIIEHKSESYRIMKYNNKHVGNYSKFFAEQLGEHDSDILFNGGTPLTNFTNIINGGTPFTNYTNIINGGSI